MAPRKTSRKKRGSSAVANQRSFHPDKIVLQFSPKLDYIAADKMGLQKVHIAWPKMFAHLEQNISVLVTLSCPYLGFSPARRRLHFHRSGSCQSLPQLPELLRRRGRHPGCQHQARRPRAAQRPQNWNHPCPARISSRWRGACKILGHSNPKKSLVRLLVGLSLLRYCTNWVFQKHKNFHIAIS